MKIAVIGRGRMGGGLADLWEPAGHEVLRIGRAGGDVSASEAVVLVLPGGAVAGAFESVHGLEGKTVIDATNLVGTQPPEGFESNAEFVKSRTHGPTAKAFNTNFAALFAQIAKAGSRPGNLWCGDEEARAVVEALSRDAGYDPISAGGLENARMLESFLGLEFAVNRAGMGAFFYRLAPPDQL